MFSLQIAVPHDLAARISYAQTYSYEIDSLKENFLIESTVSQKTNDSLIFPTDSIVVHNPNDSMCTVYVNTSKVRYSAPFKNLPYVHTPDSLSIDNIGGVPALTVGDEHFEQMFYINYYPRCDSAVQTRDTLSPAFVSHIPGFGCTDTLQSAGAWPLLYLAVPHDTVRTVDEPISSSYYGNYISWGITIHDTVTYSRYMMIFILKSIADSEGLVLKDTITGSDPSIHPDTIDAVIDSYYRFPIDITDTSSRLEVRLNICNGSINIPFSYSWSCNGLADTLPPGRDFCDSTITGNLTAFNFAPFLQDSVINTPAGNYKTCNPVPIHACIQAANEWGVGNFTSQMALPDDIIIDTSSVYLAGTHHVPGSLIDTSALTDSTRLWTINLSSYTQLGTNSSIFDSVAGFTTNSPPMCMNFNVVVTSCNIGAIPADSVTFTGTAYCGTSWAASCAFDSIFLSGNGCGPYDSIIPFDTSCTLSSIVVDSVWGGYAPYTYRWSNGDTTSTIDSLHSGYVYTDTIYNSVGCFITNTTTLHYTDGIAVNLTYNGTIVCYGVGLDNIFSGPGDIKYQWYSSDTAEHLGADTAMNNLYGIQSGEYYLTITDTNGCRANDSIFIGPYPLTDSLILNSLPCYGAATGSVTASVSGGTLPYTYHWTNGDTTLSNTTSTINSLLPGTYYITITDTNGCAIADSITLISDTLDMTVNGVFLNCSNDTLYYSIASPKSNTLYTWTFTGANISTATGDTVGVIWLPGVDSLTVEGYNFGCTSSISYAIGNCCFPQDSTLYILTNIKVSQIKQFIGTGIIYDSLPYTAIATGDSVNNVEILIRDTLWVDTDLVITNSPNVYMATNSIIIVENSHTLTLSSDSVGDTTTLLAACDTMWHGILLEPKAAIKMDGARLRDADTAVYTYNGGSINLKNAFFEQDYKGIVINKPDTLQLLYTGNTLYPFVMDGVHFLTRNTPLLTPHDTLVRGSIGIQVTAVAKINIGYDSLGQNTYYGVDTAINLDSSGGTISNQYISGTYDTGYNGVKVGIYTAGNSGYIIHPAYLNGPELKIGNSAGSNPSVIIDNCNYGVVCSNYYQSVFEVSNCSINSIPHLDNISGNTTGGKGILIQNFSSPVDGPGFVIIDNNHIYNGSTGILATNVNTALTVNEDTLDLSQSPDSPTMGLSMDNSTEVGYLSLSGYLHNQDSISNNVINANIGINSNYIYYSHIVANIISLIPRADSTTVCTGINLLQSPFTRVSCNNIYGYDSLHQNSSYGISCTSGNGSQILYNRLVTLGTGFIAYNSGKLKVINNVLQHNYVGIGVSGKNAFIGNQGGYSATDSTKDTTYDNLWEGSFPGGMLASYNFAEDSILDTFHVVSPDTIHVSPDSFYIIAHDTILDTIIFIDTFFVKNSPSSLYDPYSNIYAIYYPNVTQIAKIGEANFIVADPITPIGEYNSTFPPDDCQPPANIQLRSPDFGNDTSPTEQNSSTILTSQLDYKLIPNLFRDIFTAHITLGNNEQGEVQIYNINGILMGRHLLGAGVNELNLGSDRLPPGVYLYKVFVNGQIKTNDKLVVVH